MPTTTKQMEPPNALRKWAPNPTECKISKTSSAHFKTSSKTSKTRSTTSTPKTSNSSTSKNSLTRDWSNLRTKTSNPVENSPRKTRLRKKTTVFMKEVASWTSIWTLLRKRRTRSCIKYMGSGSCSNKLHRKIKRYCRTKEAHRKGLTLQILRAKHTPILPPIWPMLSPSSQKKIKALLKLDLKP